MDDHIAAGPWRAAGATALALLALAAAGCKSTYVGTTATSFLNKVRTDRDPNVRYLAYAKLASPHCYDNSEQKAEAVQVLVAKLAAGAEPTATRAVICHTLGELRDPGARNAILKAVNDPDGLVRVEACRALGKVGKPEDATVLARIMAADTSEDCRVAAVDALAELKPDDPRIARMLTDGMQHEDPAIRLASVNALRAITGRDLGVDPAPWVKMFDEKAGSPPTALAGRDAKPAAPAGRAYPPAPLAVRPSEDPDAAPARDGSTRPASMLPAPRDFPSGR